MQNKKIDFISYCGDWATLKYPHHILDIVEFLLKNDLPQSLTPGRCMTDSVIQDNVFIDESAKILEGAIVKGPCYIGKNVVVGNNALVRDSIVEENSVIGFGSEVARS
jgi:NDP-sugar pyrophosphorylase family protein